MKILALLLALGCPVSIATQTERAATAGVVVIRNVTVIPMTGAPPLGRATVVIRGDRISRIVRAKDIPIPERAKVIDGTGKFLIPAFWDMHVHILNADRMLPLFVANGVLEVRDLGVPKMGDVLRWKKDAAQGKLVSPRITTAGQLLDGEPSASPDYSIVVKNADEARRAVRGLKAAGVDVFKVYDVLSRDAYFAIAGESKKLGRPFVGHTPTAISTIEASNAGQKSIEHLGKILEDASSQPNAIRARQEEPIKAGDYFAFTTRMGRVYDAIRETYNTAKAMRIFERLRANGTWQVPTLTVKYGRTFIDELNAAGDYRAKYVEESQRNYWRPEIGFFSRYRTDDYKVAARSYFQKELDLVADMQRSRVKLMAGTDTPNPYVIAGFSLHDELALLVKAGLSPMHALVAATRGPAEYSGVLRQKGTIEPGKIADMILLDADPLTDIRNTTRIRSVIQRGRILSRPDLDEILSKVEHVAAKAQK